jgi:hypothetical protein
MGILRKEIQLIPSSIIAVVGGVLFLPAPRLSFAGQQTDGRSRWHH